MEAMGSSKILFVFVLGIHMSLCQLEACCSPPPCPKSLCHDSYGSCQPLLSSRLHCQEVCGSSQRHVPVVESTTVSHEEECVTRQVPYTKRYCRPVVETRTRHVPICKTRCRTYVEPYTEHIPVTEKTVRCVEEASTGHIPVTEKRCKPVIHRTIYHLPVGQRCCRPVLQSRLPCTQCCCPPGGTYVEERIGPYCTESCCPSSVCSFCSQSPCCCPSQSSCCSRRLFTTQSPSCVSIPSSGCCPIRPGCCPSPSPCLTTIEIPACLPPTSCTPFCSSYGGPPTRLSDVIPLKK